MDQMSVVIDDKSIYNAISWSYLLGFHLIPGDYGNGYVKGDYKYNVNLCTNPVS